MDADELLKATARESVKQGENLRAAVRAITLGALRSRDLTLEEIRRVVRAVTEGVNLGAAANANPEHVMRDALAGMDEALLKTVQANRLALERLSAQGQGGSQLGRALDDLERLEDEFLATVKDATRKAGKQAREQWAAVLKQSQASGTQTAGEVEATLEAFGGQLHAAVKQQRRTALKAAETMAQSFTALASGILIGLTEGLEQGRRKGGNDGRS